MAEPTSPGEIPHDTSLSRLVECRQRHTCALFDHQFGLAPLTDQQRAGHALAELAYSHALAERVLFGRWVVAVEALEAGAGHDQVAAAMGLDVDELRAGLRAWAHGQRRHGLIDDARHADVLALLGQLDAETPPAGES